MANQNSAGEMTFDLGAQQTYRFSAKILDPKKEYEFKILGKQTKKGKKDEPGKMPYVMCPFEVLKTAEKDGDRNSIIFHNLFTSLKPDKQGKVMPNRQDQLTGIAQASGSLPQLPTVFIPTGETDEATGELLRDEKGNPRTQACLNPDAIQKWLEGLDGKVIKGKVKTDKGKDGYADKTVIDFFIAASQAHAGNGSPDPFAEEDKKKGKGK